jgi:hypothetical protein
LLGSHDINSGLVQSRQTFVAVVTVDDMHKLVTGLESFGHEREHHAIFFFLAGEERAGVAWTGARGPSYPD